MNWKLVIFLCCTFGFFKDLRPSEAYLTSYLTGEWKNLTEVQVDNEVYPWWTYSYLLWLVPVFILTDFFRYKPMLIIDGLAYIGTWALLLWAQGVPLMKLMQVTFGLATACDVGYYSYLFAIVPVEHFKKVASFTRGASLIAKCVAYLLGQLFVSYSVLDFFQLNIFSFISVTIAFIITLFLPKAEFSQIFHGSSVSENKTENGVQTAEEKVPDIPLALKVKSGLSFLMQEVISAYSSKSVILWSVWWAFASCGNFQVGNYIQNMWKVISPHKEHRHIYNGAVEGIGTFLSFISVMAVGFVPFDWSVRGRGEALMAGVCVLNAVVLVIIGRTTDIWVAYVLYDVFRATYQVVITIATAQIAKSLPRQRYGFIFGCNTFLALAIESILTAIVVDKAGLGVDVRTQFVVYGGYFCFLTLVFLVVAGVRFWKSGFCGKSGIVQLDELPDDIEETQMEKQV